MNAEKLNEIKGRTEKATGGNWWADASKWPGNDNLQHWVSSSELSGDGLCACVSKVDAEFIAHAREDIPTLVAEVERLRDVLESAGGMFSIGEGGKALDYICKGLGVDWTYFDGDDSDD